MKLLRCLCRKSAVIFLIIFLLPVRFNFSLLLNHAPPQDRVYAQTSLHLPITVKESAGAAADGFPVTVIVPLPYGQYQDTSTFRLTDSNGQTVRAQFEVLNIYLLFKK